MSDLSFEYWTDPLCIWAYVAQSRLDRLLERHGDTLEARYRIVPVFGSIPWRFREGPWSQSGVDGRVASTRRIALEHGHPEVSGEVWREVQPSSSWPIGAAIKAVFTLEEQGRIAPGTGAVYQWAARVAFFVEHRDITCRSVQLELAETHDIPRGAIEASLDDGSALASVWEDHREREALQVRGSPTYAFDGGRAMLYGNFPAGVLEAVVDELLSGRKPGASAC